MKISCLRLCIRTLGISLMLMGAAVAQGQVFNPALQNASQIQRKIATDRQIHLLTRQINQVQLQSVNLSMEIADLTGQPPGAAAAVKNSNVVNPAPSPALIAAQQSAAVAQRAAEDLKQKNARTRSPDAGLRAGCCDAGSGSSAIGSSPRAG
jgi:hypothetical protein